MVRADSPFWVAPTREEAKSIAAERLRFPQLDLELAQLSSHGDMLVRLDVRSAVAGRSRDFGGAKPPAHCSADELVRYVSRRWGSGIERARSLISPSIAMPRKTKDRIVLSQDRDLKSL
jgi:hypothetical protein